MESVATIFGASLRRFRKERGLTQKALAGKTGLSTNFVSEIERGRKLPGLLVIVKMSAALEVSVQEMLADLTPETLRALKLQL